VSPTCFALTLTLSTACPALSPLQPFWLDRLRDLNACIFPQTHMEPAPGAIAAHWPASLAWKQQALAACPMTFNHLGDHGETLNACVMSYKVSDTVYSYNRLDGRRAVSNLRAINVFSCAEYSSSSQLATSCKVVFLSRNL
jgi:hypothetical protein